jgi:hypothetical protein
VGKTKITAKITFEITKQLALKISAFLAERGLVLYQVSFL